MCFSEHPVQCTLYNVNANFTNNLRDQKRHFIWMVVDCSVGCNAGLRSGMGNKSNDGMM